MSAGLPKLNTPFVGWVNVVFVCVFKAACDGMGSVHGVLSLLRHTAQDGRRRIWLSMGMAMTRQTPRQPRQGAARRLAVWATVALLGTGAVGGLVWWQARHTPAAAQLLSGDFHALQVLSDGRLLYGQHAGTSLSVDGGRTWSAPDGAGDAMALAAAPDESQTVILAGHGVLRLSGDGGQTWQDMGFGNLPGTDLHGFALSPSDPSVRYASVAGKGLYHSENAQDWRFITAATAGAMQIAVGPAGKSGATPQLYALTMDAGLIVSGDGGSTWQQVSRAPQAAATGLYVHPDSGNIYLAGPAGVSRSEDGGADWTDLKLPEGARLAAAHPQSERQLFAVGESGAVYQSPDGGRTWSQ